MSMNLQEKTWPQVETYLKTKKTIIVPVGSTEQHGPTGLIGIDWMSAWEIAKVVGERTQTLIAPPLTIGMAVHHMAFPGTMTLSPMTYIQVITEIIQSLGKHGFTDFFFINGHGGNIAPITSAFCQAKQVDETFNLKLINWWHLPEVTEFEAKVYGNENGFHATCGEISVTMYTHPEAYKDIPKMKFKPTPDRPHWPMAPKEYREVFTDGRMGSNPELCSGEHGQKIFNLAVDSICQKNGVGILLTGFRTRGRRMGMRLLYIALVLIASSVASATQITGTLEKEANGRIFLRAEAQQCPRYSIKANSNDAEVDLTKLQTGDAITASGVLNAFSCSAVIESIDFVGLKKMLGYWHSAEGLYSIPSFNSLVFYPSKPQACLDCGLENSNSIEFRYSLTPSEGKDWVLFLSDASSTSFATIRFTRLKAVIRFYDSETGKATRTLTLSKWGNLP